MKVGNIKNTPKKKIESPVVKGASMQTLISPEEGWIGHVMRMMEVEKGGHTPRHTHDWPHINYVAEGEGILHIEGEDHKLEPGSYAYVPANKLHQFINTGEEVLKFICIVPEEGHQ